MNIKLITSISIFVFLLSCTNIEDKSNNDSFSKEKTEELSEIIESLENKNISILKETNIKDNNYTDSIWVLVLGQNLTECTNLHTENYKNKKWTYCDQGNGLDLYKVEYVEKNILFTEIFLTKNNQLFYAVEWEKRTADVNDDEATYWNCEYVIKNNYVIDIQSLGMGKTENESFDIQEIIVLWNSKKVDFLKLKKASNTK